MNAYQEFKIIGSRPIRPDGLDKVTGRARYGADLNMQGQLYGHVVRSPHAHAVIKSIDCSKALAMEGVLAVMTGQDLVEPGNQMLGSGEGAMALKDVVPMVMSQGKVLFHAQAVAAVAATSPELAAEAAQAVEVVYDVLPAVTECTRRWRPTHRFCMTIDSRMATPRSPRISRPTSASLWATRTRRLKKPRW